MFATHFKEEKSTTYIEEWDDTLMGCGLYMEHVPPVREL
jgi:hypothetical protein